MRAVFLVGFALGTLALLAACSQSGGTPFQEPVPRRATGGAITERGVGGPTLQVSVVDAGAVAFRSPTFR